MDKVFVLKELDRQLRVKKSLIEKEQNDLQLALNDDSKSTSGDKHETSRAMLHLEQEKLGKQLTSASQMQGHLEVLKNSVFDNKQVDFGSLVKTNKGFFLLGIAYGKLDFEQETVFCMNMLSPLALLMKDKKQNDAFDLNGQKYIIQQIL